MGRLEEDRMRDQTWDDWLSKILPRQRRACECEGRTCVVLTEVYCQLSGRLNLGDTAFLDGHNEFMKG